MNAVLPQDIAVRDVAEADARFHARWSARSRTYIYSMYQSDVRSPLLGRFALHISAPPDVERMAQAAATLVGEQDFAAFGQPPYGDNTVRTVHRAEWRVQRVTGPDTPLLQFQIEANAFLRGMVRRLVGTLSLVGAGLLTVDGFADILASRDIARAGVPAPACGLCLWCVRYDE
jgi:tRNA pseudouridine38-40 synthase